MIRLDDIGLVTSGVSLVQQVLALGKFAKKISGTDVISAHFDSAGQRISGDDKIEIDRQFVGDGEAIWFFIVKEIPGYTFIRAPVLESVAVELCGVINDEKNQDARAWRCANSLINKPNKHAGLRLLGCSTAAPRRR